ncbi:MAG: RNA-directed DNA polymerase [Bacteroidales bacterium]|nr:RNA-directed DNA polymerase [Bacteroidales bacterium]
MKRAGNLIHKIADSDNLRLAFYKARKGKDAKQEIIEYSNNLDENLLSLQSQILSANVRVGNYHFFTIYDPKERQICAASFSERVLHHAIMNVCHPVFEQQQIFDSYATRINKGTYAALHRAEYFQNKYQWFLKLDIRKYFGSIDHNILFILLQQKFKDHQLLQIFKQIIGSYETEQNKGLPIGNLTSQYFANYYLSFADRFIKQELKIPAYVRYMDDMVLWSNSKDHLLKAGKVTTMFLSEKLALKLKTYDLNINTHGITFLGYRIFKDKIRLSARSKKRFITKTKQYENKLKNNEWTQNEYQKHILPLLAYTNYAETKGLRENLFY